MSTVVLVLVEVLIVIVFSRLMGWGFRWLKQPLVIGEIVAGIMLGPSLFGLIAPDLWAVLFPAKTLPYLDILSEIGLIFFMFLIGLELDQKYLKGQLDIAILTSHVSILVPFSLGSLLSLLLYPLVSSNSVSFTAFALFLGAAMSITAFPVLARIITENNLQNTRLGALALTCAAVDDVTAWCLLAVAIAVTRTNSFIGALPTIFYALFYIILVFTLGRWVANKFGAHYQRKSRLSQFMLAGIYITVVGSALITEMIGIHLIFGAFLVGAVMPRNDKLIRELAEKTEDFVLIFLLPIFFAYSGLRTEIGLLNNLELWLLCGIVLAVAIIGKYVGTYGAARVCGIEKREASALGWMMNTRGLTELIVLNIGLNFGVISPLLFTMLVIMALVTTFMTSPLLEWTYPKHLIKLNTIATEAGEIQPSYRILVPVANPQTQKGLLELALVIAGKNLQPAAVYPLSLIELEEDYLFQSTPLEAERLIQERRRRLDELTATLEPVEMQNLVQPIVRISHDVARETSQIAKIDQMDLILVGWHRPAFTQNRLGGRVGQILSSAPVDVAVFVDNGKEQLNSLLVPYSANIHDDLAFEIAVRLLINDKNRHLVILKPQSSASVPHEFSYEFRAVMEQLPTSVSQRIEIRSQEFEQPILAVIQASQTADLTIVGTSRAWGIEKQTLGRYTDELANQCASSILITRRYSQITSHLAGAFKTASISLSS